MATTTPDDAPNSQGRTCGEPVGGAPLTEIRRRGRLSERRPASGPAAPQEESLMSRSRKTSARVGRTASKVLRSGNYSRASKRIAGSALSQRAPRQRAPRHGRR